MFNFTYLLYRVPHSRAANAHILHNSSLLIYVLFYENFIAYFRARMSFQGPSGLLSQPQPLSAHIENIPTCNSISFLRC